MLSNPTETLLTTEETATLLGVKPPTLIAWRFYRKPGPRFIRMGRIVRYRYSDVLDFIEKSCVKSEVTG